MVLNIIDYIGDKILTSNPYIDTFAANCIKLKGGEIVNFIGAEKENFSPSDIKGIGSYVRIEPNITYTDIPNKFTSALPKTMATLKFRLVIFQVNAVDKKLNPAKLENKINSELTKMSFSTYQGNEKEINIQVNSSNLDFLDNFVTEIGKDYEIGADSVIIALNCTLNYITASDNCDECDVFD